MEMIKNFLFNIIIFTGCIAIIVTLIWWLLELLNKIFKFSKYIIMYHEYKRREEIYDLRNTVVVSKNGHIAYSCAGDVAEQIKILNKGIDYCNKMEGLRERCKRKM